MSSKKDISNLQEPDKCLLCLNCGSNMKPVSLGGGFHKYYCTKCCTIAERVHIGNVFCSVCFSRMGMASQIFNPICSNPVCPLYSIKRKLFKPLSIYYNDRLVQDNLYVNSDVLYPSFLDSNSVPKNYKMWDEDYYPEFLSSIIRYHS